MSFDPLLFSIALVIEILGLVLLYLPGHLKRVCTARTQAKVIALIYERRRDLSGSNCDPDQPRRPQLEYQAGGQTIKVVLRTGAPGIKVGDVLELNYNPKKPRQFMVPGPRGGMAAVQAVGGIMFVAGFALAVMAANQAGFAQIFQWR